MRLLHVLLGKLFCWSFSCCVEVAERYYLFFVERSRNTKSGTKISPNASGSSHTGISFSCKMAARME